MENQVEAQVSRIHADPLTNQNIGDDAIKWDSCMGDPASVAGGSFDGTNFSPYYDNENSGVYLTEATADTAGYLYWNKNFEYNKNIHLKGTFAAGGEGGSTDDGDGITIYFGTTDITSKDNSTNGVAIFFDEYNDDTVKVYLNGSLIDSVFNTNQVLDDFQWRTYEVIYEYVSDTSAFVQVMIDGVYVCRVDVGSWISTSGTYVGVSAFCGSADNVHLCKSFEVKSATPWLTINR